MDGSASMSHRAKDSEREQVSLVQGAPNETSIDKVRQVADAAHEKPMLSR